MKLHIWFLGLIALTVAFIAAVSLVFFAISKLFHPSGEAGATMAVFGALLGLFWVILGIIGSMTLHSKHEDYLSLMAFLKLNPKASYAFVCGGLITCIAGILL